MSSKTDEMRQFQAPWLAKSRRAMGIVRVSSHKQGDGNSPDVQRNGIIAYSESLGMDLLDVAIIEESAKTSATRQKFHEALAKARKQKIRHLVFWVWDRIARNYTDVEQLEMDVRRDEFVLHLANERKVLHVGSSDSEWLTADVNTLTSKHYVRELSRRAIESMTAMAENGWSPAKLPLGYRSVMPMKADGTFKDRGRTIQVTDEGRRLVRRMAELRVRGFSLVRIASRVLEEGIVPPRNERVFRDPGNQRKVEEILKNPFYKGEFIFRGVRYQGKHEPIFSPGEWDDLQATFQVQAVHTVRKRHAPLAGWLRCSECGCRITYDPKTKANGRMFHYYRCANGRKFHPRLTYATEDQIFKSFESALDSISITDAQAKQIAGYLNESHGQAKRNAGNDLNRFRREQDTLTVREDELYSDLKRGLLDEIAYKRQQERIRVERSRLDAAIATAADQNTEYLVTAQRTLELASRAKSLWNSRSPHERRDLLEKLLSNQSWDGVTARYDLRKPFDVLAKMRGDGDWRPRPESNQRPWP